MVKNTPKIKIIVGPTSSGKTACALRECKKIGGEILSFDSRQLFRYMDIGTGKVPVGSSISINKNNTFWQIEGVKIWGYDLASPEDYFSAFDYVLFANSKIEELVKANIPIFLVGGTGFYLDVLTGKINLDLNKPDLALRASLEKIPPEEQLAKLKELDIQKFNSIDQKNPRRVARALEKVLAQKSDIPPIKNILQSLPYELIGFIAPNEVLYKRADMWLETIWHNGLLNETTFLLKNYSASYRLNGLIYKQAVDYLKGIETELSAKDKAKFGIHAYIRRQLTWFRKNPEIKWEQI